MWEVVTITGRVLITFQSMSSSELVHAKPLHFRRKKGLVAKVIPSFPIEPFRVWWSILFNNFKLLLFYWNNICEYFWSAAKILSVFALPDPAVLNSVFLNQIEKSLSCIAED